MSNDEVFQEYKDSIRRLQVESRNVGVNEHEFNKIYYESLKRLSKNLQICNRSKKKMYIGFFLILIIIVAYNYKYLQSCITCNVQEYIYPGLRFLRKMSIPLISLFPSLTDLYQETCLVQNPFFTIVDMDCWPCSVVNNIGEVYDPQPVQQQHNAPFIYKSEQNKVDINSLKNLYVQNNKIFAKESQKVLTNNKYYEPLESIFGNNDNLYIWKINNINIARTLRKIIPRPKVVPKFGQSIERFIIIDSKQKVFPIPDTECNYSFLLVTHGQRIVTLKPADECKHQCKTLKVELKESYLLWYNWWYWRPTVQEGSSNETFIGHVGSYC